MKRVLTYLLFCCTLLCGVYGLYLNLVANQVKHLKKNEVEIGKLYLKDSYFSEGISFAHFVDTFDVVENDYESDFFNILDRFVPTPNYFFVYVYASLLVLFFALQKRKLPFWHYFELNSTTIYLTQRVLLI